MKDWPFWRVSTGNAKLNDMRMSWPLLLCFLLGCDAQQETPPVASSIAIKVGNFSIEHAEVDRLADFLRLFFVNQGMETTKSAVLVNSLLPRAVAAARYSDLVEPFHEKMLAAYQRLGSGESYQSVWGFLQGIEDIDVAPTPREGTIFTEDYLVSEQLFSLPLEQWSEPFLTKFGWMMVKVVVRDKLDDPLNATAQFVSLNLPFEYLEDYQYKVVQWMKAAKIEVVDEQYQHILPEWIKYATR